MSLELVKALLLLVKVCANSIDCKECPIKEFCGKLPSDW